AHAITTDAWRNSLDHYQEFVIIVALDLKIEVPFLNKSTLKAARSANRAAFACYNDLFNKP
ncbi:hypothetical protein EFP44_05285, partial [Lacticaseibacillus paracasei]|nr:hypothetical protein [Lacticaseibacillus paracasei]